MGGLKFCSALGQLIPSSGSSSVVWLLCFTSVCGGKRGAFRKREGELFKQRAVTVLQSCSKLSPALPRAMHVPSSYCYRVLCHLRVLSPRLQDLMYSCESKFLSLFSPAVQTHQLSILRGGSKCLPSSCLWVKSLGF